MPAKKKRPVIVRTYSAGVHYGYLVEQSTDGKRVVLEKSRRIWYWTGAASLSQLAVDGPKAGSKIGVPIRVEVTEAIEIIDCEQAAVTAIEGMASWRA